MSLYNMLFGQNAFAPVLLSFVDLDQQAVGRFRDVHLEKEGDDFMVHVYTRNGGGNREHYDDAKEPGPDCGCTGCIGAYNLPAHPLYVRDSDDDFDCTYATFVFRVPTGRRAFAEVFAPSGTPAPFGEKFVAFLDKMKSEPDSPEMRGIMAKFQPIIEQITAVLNEPKATP